MMFLTYLADFVEKIPRLTISRRDNPDTSILFRETYKRNFSSSNVRLSPLTTTTYNFETMFIQEDFPLSIGEWNINI
jgi:hypothetical protein